MGRAVRVRLVVAAAALAGAIGVTTACTHEDPWPGPKGALPPEASAVAAPEPPIFPGGVNARTAQAADAPGDPSATARSRILITPERLAALQRLRDARAPAWDRLEEACDRDVKSPLRSGYEAWDWADAALSLALCYRVTRSTEYADAAIGYFRALLDDHYKLGDAAGGDDVVHHDHGYSIRTHGCFGAIAYDWLRDAPGMTRDLREHAAERFLAWTRWFGESGYNRDQPIANYYMGYFGAVAFGGLALDGEDPRAAALRRRTKEMFSSEIVPTYRAKLAGGDFPEGWQYGDMVATILAIYVDAESRANEDKSALAELPWLRELVAYRTHALLPDGKHTLDTGDWSAKPAVAPPHALLALSLVLSQADPLGRQARALARAAADPHEEWPWLAALAGDPSSRTTDDPRRGPTSRLTPGTGVVTARTSWSQDAIWFALACAPSLSDHQHLDAGHFEIVRGDDALIVDGAGYGSYSSLSHNVIAVDDKRENDNYAPNQGTWSDSAKIARFEDRGSMVYALADYASAYNPAGYPKEHSARSVSRAEREVVFSRSAVPGLGPGSGRAVVYDRMTLAKPVYASTFLLHGGSVPAESPGGGIRFVVGRSQAIVSTIVPGGVSHQLVREPTTLGDGAYYANSPPEGTTSVRVEVRSPTGDVERRFLHAIVVAGGDARAPSPERIEGEGVDGVAVGDEAYVFERGAVQLRALPVVYRAPISAVRHLVASLAPGAHYAVGVEREGTMCHVVLRPGEGIVASSAGTLLLDVTPSCSLASPSAP
ncbi:MAG TPA: hypothetical protein VEK07_10235 [Polyangiaceae bacterium]|nr:hypothetical protein [Polyangiaceae bacterium]